MFSCTKAVIYLTSSTILNHSSKMQPQEAWKNREPLPLPNPGMSPELGPKRDLESLRLEPPDCEDWPGLSQATAPFLLGIYWAMAENSV